MITKESWRNDAVIDHFILQKTTVSAVYWAVKERKKRYENLA